LVVTRTPSELAELAAVTIRCGRMTLRGRPCQARLFEIFFFPEGPLVRPNPETTQPVGRYVGPGRFVASDDRWKLRHRCWSGKPVVSRDFVCSISRNARERGSGAVVLADLLHV
jgi:hypothetical protein